MTVTFIPAEPWTGRDDAEDGPTARRMYHLEGEGKHALIGFACEAGVRRNKGRVGARKAPKAIRRILAGLAAPENAIGFKDLGTVDVDIDALEEGQEALAGRIGTALKSHQRVVVLGGGHETAYASFLGLHSQMRGKKIGIINLDAHLDIRNVGDQGGSSGTPFNQIRSLDTGNFDYLCIGAAGESNTQALFQRAKEWGVAIVRDHSLIANPNAADKAIEALIARSDVIYLTIDIDVMPHEQAPGVSAPAARGIPFSTIERLVTLILKRAKTAGTPVPVADIVEVSPPFDLDNMTARRAAFLARRLLLCA